MRIITGIAKGRALNAPKGLDTRPTSDRVKEALFNIIAKRVNGSKILDLFSGTGNLGLEAISRGAALCTFIEKNKNTYKILKDNIQALGFNDKSESYNQDAFIALDILGRGNAKYDIIFLDPPYSKGLIEKSIEMITKLGLLNDGGVIVGEYDENDEIPKVINNTKIIRTEKYGRTKISFWSGEE